VGLSENRLAQDPIAMILLLEMAMFAAYVPIIFLLVGGFKHDFYFPFHILGDR
jgi:hypothetical protein